MRLSQLRRCAINTFVAAIVLAVVIDALPQSPFALQQALTPTLKRLGIDQGPWKLFAPEPDRMNIRLLAEIAYRDGERRKWNSPDWKAYSPAARFVGHRRFEWLDHVLGTTNAPATEPWCRTLAREVRPDFPDADRGAEVRVIYEEALIPTPEPGKWRSIREPTVYGESWVLNIEKLE